MNRPDWNTYFFNVAKVISTRSTCLRRQIASVAVKDKRILATGYNGAPTGVKHCIDRGGCMRTLNDIPSGTQQEKCFAIHAEENLLVQAACHGIRLRGCDIYCTHQPCIMCTRKLINIKPRRIYYLDTYPDAESISLLGEVAIYSILPKKSKGEYVHCWELL